MLVFSLGLSPSFAHMGGAPGPVARPGAELAIPSPSRRTGSTGVLTTGRSGFNRLGPNRFNRYRLRRLQSLRLWSLWLEFAIHRRRLGLGRLGRRGSGRGVRTHCRRRGRACDHQYRRRSRFGRLRAPSRRLRHPQAQLRQQRQVCRRASNSALLISAPLRRAPRSDRSSSPPPGRAARRLQPRGERNGRWFYRSWPNGFGDRAETCEGWNRVGVYNRTRAKAEALASKAHRSLKAWPMRAAPCGDHHARG